jgi:hypothetical protein
MILQIILAFFFTNVLGVLFDRMEKLDDPLGGKQYLNSTIGVFSMLLFRSIFFILRGIVLLTKKDLLNSVSISIFVLSIFLLFDYQSENLGLKIKVLVLCSFCLWSIIYAYLAVTTKVFYEGKNLFKLSEKETKVYFGEATFSDKIALFFINILSSIISPPIYGLTIATVLYIHFLGILL